MKINDKLKKAVEKNDLVYIYKVCTKDIEDINEPINENGDNLFLWAIEREDDYLIDRLLKNKNLDINYVNKSNYCAINKIVRKLFNVDGKFLGDSKPELFNTLKRILSRQNVDVNIQDAIYGLTPWMNVLENERDAKTAKENGYDYTEIEDLFFKRNDLKINLISSNGRAAIHKAVDKQNSRVIDYLLNKPELQINSEGTSIKAPLLIAIINSDIDTFHKILANKNVKLRDESRLSDPLEQTLGMIGLGLSLKKKNEKSIREIDLEKLDTIANILLDRNDIDVNFHNEYESTIHDAYSLFKEAGYKYINKIVAKEDVDLNVTDKDGNTVLMKAIRDGELKLVESILNKQNVDVNAKNKAGETALTIALDKAKDGEKVSIKILDKLLTYPGININDWEERNKREGLRNAIATEKEELVDKMLDREDLSLNTPYSLDNLDNAINKLDYNLINKIVKNKHFSPDTRDSLNSNVISHIFDYSTFVIPEGDIISIQGLVLDSCSQENIEKLLNDENNLGNNALMTAVEIGVSGELVQGFLNEVVKRFGYVNIDFDKENKFGQSIRTLARTCTTEKNKGDIERVINRYIEKCKGDKIKEAQVKESSEEEILTKLDTAVSNINYNLLNEVVADKNFSPEIKDQFDSNIISHLFDYSTYVLSDEEMLAMQSIILDSCSKDNIEKLLNEQNQAGNNAIMSALQLGVSENLVKGFLDEVVKRFGYIDIDFDIKNKQGNNIYELAKACKTEKSKGNIEKILKNYKENCKLDKNKDENKDLDEEIVNE